MDTSKHILGELKAHVPFTIFGAFLGMVIMGTVCSVGLAQSITDNMFHILHPLHLLLSAIVTATVYSKHSKNSLFIITIGVIGSISLCSLSDIVFPYLGGVLLGAKMELHICLLEHTLLVLLPVLVGAMLGAKVIRWTRCPHATHVLISTMASLFYLITFGVSNWVILAPAVFILLFISVWLPCCASDIIFPHLFTKREPNKS